MKPHGPQTRCPTFYNPTCAEDVNTTFTVAVWVKPSLAPYSPAVPRHHQKMPRGTRPQAFSKSQEHMWTEQPHTLDCLSSSMGVKIWTAVPRPKQKQNCSSWIWGSSVIRDTFPIFCSKLSQRRWELFSLNSWNRLSSPLSQSWLLQSFWNLSLIYSILG